MPDIMTEAEIAELRALVADDWEMSGHAIARVHIAVPRLLATVEAMREPVSWLYLNPDTGLEIAGNHPVESGEVPDAENIVPIRDDEAVKAITDAWWQVAEAERERDEARAENARLREALEWFVWDAEHPLSDLNHAEVIRQAETLEEALRGL